MPRIALPPLPLPASVWREIARELRLPPQQKRIAGLILRHQCDKQIAAILRIKVPTVRTYLGRMFDRLGVSDREQLILLIFRLSHGRQGPAAECHRRRCHRP